MPIPPDGLEISQESWERLLLQGSWLEGCRTVHKVDWPELMQLCFAENIRASDAIEVMRQFYLLVEKGITPPPLILAALARGFKKYIDAEPHASLDNAFDLKPKKRVGHPLSHRLWREERGRICFQMYCLRRDASLKGETLSIENAAGQLIGQLTPTGLTEDTLKKDYIKMNCDEIFNNAFKVLEEFVPKNQ